MSRPILWLDFDGVLNAFPEPDLITPDLVGRVDRIPDPEGGTTGRYSRRRAFPLDRTATVTVRDRPIPLHWSGELSANLYRLAVDGTVELEWLSTWFAHTDLLNRELGWDSTFVGTARWATPGDRSPLRKAWHVRRHVERWRRAGQNRPVIWIDDEAVDGHQATRWANESPGMPMLLVAPDARTGISRVQWDLIHRFAANPPAGPQVIWSPAWGREGQRIDHEQETDNER